MGRAYCVRLGLMDIALILTIPTLLCGAILCLAMYLRSE